MDAGAGQLFYTVPVARAVHHKEGSTETFVGCYTLHLSQPPIQGTPPFRPLGVRSAKVERTAAGADVTALLAQSCR